MTRAALTRVAILAALLALALSWGCGNSGNGAALAPVEGPALAWPPLDLPGRTLSDNDVELQGKDFSASGGGAAAQGTFCALGPAGPLNYAIYTVTGLGPTVVPGEIEVVFNANEESSGDGTALYLGLSNYSTGRWDWFDLGVSPALHSYGSGADYISPAGSSHAAIALGGPGTGRIDTVRFVRTGSGAFTAVPQNLTADPQFGVVVLDWDAVPRATGYNVYRSYLPDFAGEIKLNSSQIAANHFEDDDVQSDRDTYYRVTAVRGTESAKSEHVMVHTMNTDLPAPENLSGTGNVGSVDLTWDAVPQAISYFVYRSPNLDFSGATQVGTVSTTAFTDSAVGQEDVFYYEVSAFAITESPRSNRIDVYVPSVDLPAPQSVRIEWLRGDGVRIAWDWADADPDFFRIYFSFDKDFGLDGPFYHSNTVAAGNRNYTLFGLQPGTNYYVRVQAWQGSGRGRPSDDLLIATESFWQWEAPAQDIEVSGPADGPLAAISAVGDISCTYFAGSEVMLARRTAGVWASESTGLNSTVVGGGFSNFQDLDYGNGRHLVGSFAGLPGDAYVSVGNPGESWVPVRVHGDGATGPNHAVSGLSCKVAASDTEYALCHMLEGEFSHTALFHTAPVAGSWSQETTRNLPFEPLDASMVYDGGNLYSLLMDYSATELLFGSNATDPQWDWADVTGGAGQLLGAHNDLQRYAGEWITPAYNGTDQSVNVLQGDGASWEQTEVVSGFGGISSVEMIQLPGDELMLAFQSNSPVRWYCAHYNGTEWNVTSLDVYMPDGSDIGNYVALVNNGGEPWAVFTTNTGKLRATRGIPPS
jgi:hypothetical protein